MSGEHYTAFIKEAFIDPIRSVLIVDDDYPTFDEVLDAQVGANGGIDVPCRKGWAKNPARIKNVIARFRDPRHPLVVDIHDGSNVPAGAERAIAAHLNQSDLLVLDYQLDRSRPNDGTIAFEIIRSLMTNDHFNLVVVHTSEALDTVFRNTLVAMMPAGYCAPPDADAKRAAELLEECEDKIEGSYNRIRASIGEDAYIFARGWPQSYSAKVAKSEPPFSTFGIECEALQWSVGDRKKVAAYLLAEVEKEMAFRLNPGQASGLLWGEEPVKYIMTDSVFVAFSEKGEDCDLIECLLHALKASRPLPSHLFLAKLRAAMDKYGVIAQGAVLETTSALAHWYHRLLSSGGSERESLIDDSVVRHSERLMNGIHPHVANFAKRLVEIEAPLASADDITKAHFGIDLSKPDAMSRAELEHNALVSTMAPAGWHLTTGHVFAIDNDFWVCVSPACDMVPNQLRDSRSKAFGERLPFMAVRLIKVSKLIGDIHSNRYLFLLIDGRIVSFCFNEPSDGSSAPVWHTLYAEKRGEFHDGLSFTVSIAELDGDMLVQRVKPARVVAQLRYEYALNLVQKLGGSVTRIGLDFVGRREKSS
ncbi:MAG: hypothetical protein HQL42_12485 [Alphaproteobacteria bacterium]|nr:hypothetical protein [Alphaproteobacteria bacterium]